MSFSKRLQVTLSKLMCLSFLSFRGLRFTFNASNEHHIDPWPVSRPGLVHLKLFWGSKYAQTREHVITIGEFVGAPMYVVRVSERRSNWHAFFSSSQQHDGGIYVLLLPAAAPKICRPELPEHSTWETMQYPLIPAPSILSSYYSRYPAPSGDCKVKLNMASFRVAILLRRPANVAQ